MSAQSPPVASASVLEPSIQALVDRIVSHGAQPIHTLTPEEARNALLRIQPEFKTRNVVETLKIQSGGQVVNLHVIRPQSAPERSAAVVYFHGGGWVVGDYNTHGRLANQLADASNAVVFFVNYDRAPESRYPIAVQQAYAATRYLAQHSHELGIDASHLIVAGDSSGANIATVTTLIAKQESGPKIAGQLLLYPATNANFETASYQQFSAGPWLTKAAMQWFWDQYLPNASERALPTASPLQASLQQLQGLPRTLIITAEHDVLRDEGEAYGRRLMQAGVETVCTRYNGVIHDFLMFDAIADAPPARAALLQAADFIKTLTGEKEANTERSCSRSATSGESYPGM